jgi:hypothetical protein
VAIIHRYGARNSIIQRHGETLLQNALSSLAQLSVAAKGRFIGGIGWPPGIIPGNGGWVHPAGVHFSLLRALSICMDSPRTVKPEATAFPPELERLGIAAGTRIDIRDLDALSKHHNFQAYLYFEEDLARGSTLGRDLEDYRHVPEVERPFVNLDEFLRFATGSDPLFSSYLDELPLVIEILACGEIHAEDGEAVAYVKGLMPFLDELDMDLDMDDALPGAS